MLSLQEGTPTSTNALIHWDYALANVQVAPDLEVMCYNVMPNGFMRQIVSELVKHPNKVTSTVSYRTISDASVKQPLIRITLLDIDGKTSFVLVPLIPNKLWSDIETTIDVPTTVTSIKFEILNRSEHNLLVTNMQLSANTLSEDAEYDVNKFIQQCVLYGNDADKPNLRGDANA